MKCPLLICLFLSFGSLVGLAKEPAGTVLIHPGEVVYVRFEQKGIKLKLLSVSKEKDEYAQVIVTRDPVDPAMKAMTGFKIVNKFPLDLLCKKEMRALKIGTEAPLVPVRVVGGRLFSEDLPYFVDEIALTGFVLEK